MISGSVGRRYARALSMVAEEKAIWKEIVQDLKSLGSLWEDENFKKFIKEPTFTRKERTKIMLEIAEKAGVGEIVKNFLEVLCLKGRLEFFPDVVREFSRMYENKEKIVRVVISTPVKLSEDLRQKIEGVIKKSTGKKPVILENINEDLIAGARISIDGKVFDGSAKTMIAKIISSKELK